MKILSSLFALIIILAPVFSCAPKEKRLEESGFNSHFLFDVSKPFADYVSYSKNILRLGRLDSSEEAIFQNSPFFLKADDKTCSKKDKKSILLIHGLTDSPYSSKDLANFFNQKCFDVYSLLLAGHGTRPGDLLQTSYKDWIRQVQYAVKEIAKDNQKIYLSGFSTGGALALDYVLSDDASKKVEGILLFAPAIDLTNVASLSVVVRYFKKYLNVYDDKDQVKYESFATNAAAQIYLLTKKLQKEIKDHRDRLERLKVFAVLSYEDSTIDAKNSLEILLKNTNPDKRRITIYSSDPMAKELEKEKNLFVVNSVIAEEKILSLSHLSIMVPSKNLHYGKNASYRNCLHYYNKSDLYKSCLSVPEINQGEINKTNLSKGLMRRITYNPFFDVMLEDVVKFFEL